MGHSRLLHFQKTIFSALENDPLFAHSHGEDLSLEKYRELSFLRCKRVMEYSLLPVEEMVARPLSVQTLITCLGMYDWSLAVKFLLHMLVSGQGGGRRRVPPGQAGGRGTDRAGPRLCK